jgi:hypothetical protein
MKKILILLIAIPFFVGCISDDNVNTVQATLKFDFTHNWDGEPISNDDLGLTTFINANGDELMIERLRYLVSNVRLYRENGTSTLLQGYQLIDVSSSGTLSFSTNENMPEGNYNFISFTLGFSEGFNTSGIYSDLNATSWNWPEELGGGYHFLQMDGTYTTPEGQQPFNYHMGTARVGAGVFEANYIEVFVSRNFSIEGNTNFEFRMNVAEWFKNPHIWDLNEYNTDLMMNYTAQKRMNDNGQTAFSLGPVTTP